MNLRNVHRKNIADRADMDKVKGTMTKWPIPNINYVAQQKHKEQSVRNI